MAARISDLDFEAFRNGDQPAVGYCRGHTVGVVVGVEVRVKLKVSAGVRVRGRQSGSWYKGTRAGARIRVQVRRSGFMLTVG